MGVSSAWFLKQAGFESLPDEIDVLVLGAGVAGLSAALSARDPGLSVV